MIEVPRFGMFEHSFQQTGTNGSPYTQISATAHLVEPEGKRARQIPLFWDGGETWLFRFSPDRVGTWSWTTHSDDSGLDGHSGTFEVVPSDRQGSIRPMAGYPYHLQREDGSRFWFLGDTAWSLYTDSAQQGHDRTAAKHYIEARVSGIQRHPQHAAARRWLDQLRRCAVRPPCRRANQSRVLAGGGSTPRLPNSVGIVGGLMLAWGRKKWDEGEPFAWDRFPDRAAQVRYARYAAARYSAYDVYFRRRRVERQRTRL